MPTPEPEGSAERTAEARLAALSHELRDVSAALHVLAGITEEIRALAGRTAASAEEAEHVADTLTN